MDDFLDEYTSCSSLSHNKDISSDESNSSFDVPYEERSNSHRLQMTRLRFLEVDDDNSGCSISFQDEAVKLPSNNSAVQKLFDSYGALEAEYLEDFSDIGPNNVKSNRITVRKDLFQSAALEIRPLKREASSAPIENTPTKRTCSAPVVNLTLDTAISATEDSIICAVQRLTTEPDLIGDFSKVYCLPLITSKHQDLKAISAETLANLIKGYYNDAVASFKIIDGRYPYEFEGGHIEGAQNIYTNEQCRQLLHESCVPAKDSVKRHILVFHCEFSIQRGPNLYRYLRKEDRQKNSYPYLDYPEMYLLEGGYKSFFYEHSEMCTPRDYIEMLHPDHQYDLRQFKQNSVRRNAGTRKERRPNGRIIRRQTLF